MDITCRVCGDVKPSSEFYQSVVRKCGTIGECKDCTKERVRARARTNPAVQAYDRERSKCEKRQALRARISAQWREKNPLAYKAQTAVSNAVRDGKITKEPCLFCGDPHVHGHHRDYSKPLSVIWLCPKCHHRLHAAFPETEGANKSA